MFSLKEFDAFVCSLKVTTLHDQWQARVAKVDGKVFAVLGLSGAWRGSLVFKTTDISYQILIEEKGIRRAPYLPKGNWVSVGEGAQLSDDDLKSYLGQSYQLVCRKLTHKRRAELGIEN